MDTFTAMELLGCSRRWLQQLRADGKIRIVAPANGRGNLAIYGIPLKMIQEARKK